MNPKSVLQFLRPFLYSNRMTSWLENSDWDYRPDFVSNEVQNVGTLL